MITWWNHYAWTIITIDIIIAGYFTKIKTTSNAQTFSRTDFLTRYKRLLALWCAKIFEHESYVHVLYISSFLNKFASLQKPFQRCKATSILPTWCHTTLLIWVGDVWHRQLIGNLWQFQGFNKGYCTTANFHVDEKMKGNDDIGLESMITDANFFVEVQTEWKFPSSHIMSNAGTFWLPGSRRPRKWHWRWHILSGWFQLHTI